MTHRIIAATLVSLVTVAHAAFARQDHPPMPPGMTHAEHLAQMAKDADLKKRGADAMGFDQDAAAHHFRLLGDGGAIEVGAKDAANVVVRDAIRAHLREIATQFSQGVFDKPVATHAEVPPGVETMQALKAHITYAYEQSDAGGRVRITADDATALAAVHEFLVYQIKEHATGDPVVVRRP
jgi:hypothetical protein